MNQPEKLTRVLSLGSRKNRRPLQWAALRPRTGQIWVPLRITLIIPFLFFLLATPSTSNSQIQTPNEFLGYRPETNRKLAGWQEITEYLKMLEENTERVKLQQIGESTEKRPMMMAIISSAPNIKNLALYKNYQKQAANPAHMTDDDIELLAKEDKVVVMIILNANSRQVSTSQGVFALAHFFASEPQKNIDALLSKVILLLIPSLNPDAIDKVALWYNKYVGLPHEGATIPNRTHLYAGDDIEFDWDMLNTVETKSVVRQIFQYWFPQVVLQVGARRSRNSRLVLENVTTNDKVVNTYVQAKLNDLTKSIIAKMHSRGMAGLAIQNRPAQEPPGTLTRSFLLRNIIAQTAQIANTHYASPLYFAKGSIIQSDEPGLELLSDWNGGWWRMGDFIRSQTDLIKDLLQAVSADKEQIIRDYCQMNKQHHNTAKSKPQPAYIIPAKQKSPHAARKFLQSLYSQGIEIHKAKTTLTPGSKLEPEDYVILPAQPFERYIHHIFDSYAEQLQMPAGNDPGSPQPPIAFSLPQVLEVSVDRAETVNIENLKRVHVFQPPAIALRKEGSGHYIINHADNQSTIAVNRMLEKNKKIFWLTEDIEEDGRSFERGTIVMPRKEISANLLAFLAQELTLEVRQTKFRFQQQQVLRLKKPAVALYQPWHPEPDPGWTQYLLEKYEFNFDIIYSHTVSKRDLTGKYDAIIFPDMPPEIVLHGWLGQEAQTGRPLPPQPYVAGIGESGLLHLKQFVLNGGTLIALGQSCKLLVEKLELPIDVLRAANSHKNNSTHFFELRVDVGEPIAFGMSNTAIAALTAGPILRPRPWVRRIGVAATFLPRSFFPPANLEISNLPAAIDLPQGSGRVVLLPIRTQFRAQTAGTFKLLFNSLHLSRSKLTLLK